MVNEILALSDKIGVKRNPSGSQSGWSTIVARDCGTHSCLATSTTSPVAPVDLVADVVCGRQSADLIHLPRKGAEREMSQLVPRSV